MRRAALLSLTAAAMLLAAASAPVVLPVEPVDAELARARAEASVAAKRLATLEAQAANAGNEAARLKAERAAAAAAIEDSEARISSADAALRLARARVALGEQRLAKKRAPLAALLAGLATMGRQPPLLSLADGGSLDEMVRVRALLDTTMPLIERRSAALGAELGARRRLAAAADAARTDLTKGRDQLARRQQRFAELEASAATRAASLQGEAFGAGDRVLASDDALDSAGGDAARRRAAMTNAAALLPLGFARPRPMRGDAPLPTLDFAYSLPLDAPLAEGLGSVSPAGIVSRGVRFANPRGAPVIVPADGKILFAAPYRGQDGIVIIDHGRGWTSLLLGVASDVPRGSAVRRGQPLGRALGPVGAELRRAGRPVSPAFIAASSVALSNGGNNR